MDTAAALAGRLLPDTPLSHITPGQRVLVTCSARRAPSNRASAASNAAYGAGGSAVSTEVRLRRREPRRPNAWKRWGITRSTCSRSCFWSRVTMTFVCELRIVCSQWSASEPRLVARSAVNGHVEVSGGGHERIELAIKALARKP